MKSDENLHPMNICQLTLWRKFGFTLPLLFIPPLLSDFPMAAFLCEIQKHLSLFSISECYFNICCRGWEDGIILSFLHLRWLFPFETCKSLVPDYWFLTSSLKIKQGNLFHNTTCPWLFNLYVLACLVVCWHFVTRFHVADLKLAV